MYKELWRQSWLDAINGLTSLELQKNNHVKMNDYSSHRSFDDYVNFYFGELLCGFNYDFYVEEMNWITQEEYETVKNWHYELEYGLFSSFEYSNIEEILNDAIWYSILQDGILVKQKLISIIPEAEKKYLT